MDKKTAMLYRREFLRRSALAAASVAVLSCTGGGPTTASPSAARSLTPVKGGTLTWGQWDKIDVIDPALTTGAAAGEITQNILDTLITLDAEQKPHPALATKWTIEDGGKKFTFTLRDGVKFIKFGDFTNQLDYADAASELNNKVKTDVLAKVKATELVGKKVSFAGAFSLVAPGVVLIVPTELAPAS